MSAITDFLEGRGADGAGRSIRVVLAFGPASLERHHDFIQWVFPLPEPSQAVPGSPVLTPSDIDAIRSSPLAQENLGRATALMTRFYEEGSHWLRPGDHNHLRITRIIRSLRLLVGDATADAFRAKILRRVETAHASVGATTRAYWLAA